MDRDLEPNIEQADGSWPQVGVRLSYDMAAGHAELAGVVRYAAHYGPWTIMTHPRGGFTPLQLDRPFTGSGMIVHISPPDGQKYRQTPFPVVNVGSLVPDTGLPSVLPDNHAIGRMAAEYLMDRGFDQIGFCGFVGHGYSDTRCAGVTQTVNAHARGLFVYPQVERHLPEQGGPVFAAAESANMIAWLQSLPRPVGVVCANDMRASQLLAVCRRVGIAVPEEVAIVGVDNDVLLCETLLPPLSSVAIPFEQLGYEAAALLDRMMKGKPAPNAPILIPPTGVVTRTSSDILAIRDADIAQALRYIRENASHDVSIAQVLEAVPMSRRNFERRFKEVVRRTPQDEITRVKVELAKHLLSQSDLSMSQVAARCGLASGERLSVVFRRKTGLTPSSYRNQFRQR